MILQHAPQPAVATRPRRRCILSQLADAHPAIMGKVLTVSEEVSPSPYLQTGEPGLPLSSF
ncbi:MAG TPA: hypothetical protein VMI06_04510 [Terriglobia bacterium]|nr:hypothetical protein [Terriglobia bacterium]